MHVGMMELHWEGKQFRMIYLAVGCIRLRDYAFVCKRVFYSVNWLTVTSTQSRYGIHGSSQHSPLRTEGLDAGQGNATY